MAVIQFDCVTCKTRVVEEPYLLQVNTVDDEDIPMIREMKICAECWNVFSQFDSYEITGPNEQSV